jgi:hypothetical protein
MSGKPVRALNAQTYVAYALPVTVAAVALSSVTQQSNLNALYTTMILSVPVGGTPVFMGNANVAAASGNGLQIPAGVPIVLSLGNERELYELERGITQDWTCNEFMIPFIVWDTSQIFFAAAAPQTMGVILFAEVFI